MSKKRYVDLLKSTDRKGIDGLIAYMEQSGFFKSPCSTRHHLAEPGGLLKHSLNVYDTAMALKNALNSKVSDKSITLCALLHDIGKCGQYGKAYYVPNVLKSGKISEAEPYSINKELLAEEHEVRSVIIASSYIHLTEEEQNAILHHNGSWCKLDSSYSSVWDKCELTMIIHFADLYCSRFVEV